MGLGVGRHEIKDVKAVFKLSSPGQEIALPVSSKKAMGGESGGTWVPVPGSGYGSCYGTSDKSLICHCIYFLIGKMRTVIPALLILRDCKDKGK